jgi:hypothetical protein
MSEPDARHLLGGHATETLTKTERERLMRAVLEDTQLFEAFVEEEEWRAVLSDTGFRTHLRARLRELLKGVRTSWRERFGWLLRPQWLAVASAAVAIVVVVLIRQGFVPESSPVAKVVLGSDALPALQAAGILEVPDERESKLETDSRSVPPKDAGDAAIALDREGDKPTYHVGDRQRIGFRISVEASVILVETRADGSIVRLYPNRFQSSPVVKPGDTVLVPPAGQGDLTVEGPTGERSLRLLVFLPSVDPLAANVSWAQVRDQARAVEKKYEVLP